MVAPGTSKMMVGIEGGGQVSEKLSRQGLVVKDGVREE